MLQLVPQPDSDPHMHQDNQEVQQRFQLANLLRMTEEMLCCAQEGEWESVDAMEKSRKQEISACFDNVSSDDAPLIKEALATLIHLNEKITLLVRQEKLEMIALQKKTKDSRTAVTNYQNYQNQDF